MNRPAFRALEAFNVSVCEATGAGQGSETTLDALAAYDRVLVLRVAECAALIAAARAEANATGDSTSLRYVHGMEGALDRARTAPRAFTSAGAEAAFAAHMVTETTKLAFVADEAFSEAVKVAGYKSRWDWKKSEDNRPYCAYVAKLQADEAMHRAHEWHRAARSRSLAAARA